MEILLGDVNDRDPEFNKSATYTAHVSEVGKETFLCSLLF